ncbi:MAG: sugar transferase [Clostridia bacterium]
MYAKYIKRMLDFILSLIALIVLSPLMIIIGILVRIKLGKPVIFKQKRPGKNEKIFTLYKFRTMTDEKDEQGNLLADEKRLTKFGKFLRSTSLDELPELWNILKGEMAIVGPRPLLVEYLPLYNEEQKHRHDIKPGLTGLAQISGRNAIQWEEKFKEDIEYVNNITFIQDTKIILKTFIKVFKKDGINQEGNATIRKFEGVKKEKINA